MVEIGLLCWSSGMALLPKETLWPSKPRLELFDHVGPGTRPPNGCNYYGMRPCLRQTSSPDPGEHQVLHWTALGIQLLSEDSLPAEDVLATTRSWVTGHVMSKSQTSHVFVKLLFLG